MPRRAHPSATAIGLAMLACAAAAQPAGPLAHLRQAGTLTCQPAHDHFCANMHLACAGQATIATFAFSVHVRDGKGTLAAASPEAAVWLQAYQNAPVTWDARSASLIMQPPGAPGYLRVQESGRYSLRIYLGARGVMSVGHCR